MVELKPILTHFAFLAFLTVSGCTGEKPTTVITRHEARYPHIQKKYLYQSVIRLANLSGDPAFNELIKDVRKVTIYLPPREDSTYQIQDVSSGMREEGYEELMSVRMEDANKISLWVNESTSRPHYMGLLDTEDDDIIFEIDGQLNLKYISALKFADQGSLMDLIN